MRTLVGKSMPFPPDPLGEIFRLRRFDRRAALVGSRPQRLFDQGVGHLVDLARRIDDEQIDRADVPAGSHGWTDREDRSAHDVTPQFGDEDGGVGQEDELSKQIGRCRLARDTRAQPVAAQCDETVDVRDPGRSDPVVHALVCSHEGRTGRRVFADRTGGACNAPEIFPGGERPVLQSVRRALSYDIASAATCASPGAGSSSLRRHAPQSCISVSSTSPEARWNGERGRTGVG
jgi:hypothetical protein